LNTLSNLSQSVSTSDMEIAVSTTLRSLKTLEHVLDIAGLNKVFIAKNPYINP